MLLNRLFSMQAGTILLLIFAFFCAIATFVENDFGTQTAFSLIYSSWWFGLIQVYLVALIIYNMFRFRLFSIQKLPSLIFHFSFLFILIGSAFTRYFGFEGIVHIREGQKQNVIESAVPYVQLTTHKNGKTHSVSKEKFFSILGNDSLKLSLGVENQNAVFNFKKIVPNAVKTYIQDKNGEAIVALNISKQNENLKEVVLKKGELSEFISFENIAKKDFLISLENEKFYFQSDKQVGFYNINNGNKGLITPNTKSEFLKNHIYKINDLSIYPKTLLSKAKESFISSKNPNDQNAVIIGELSYKGITKEVAFMTNSQENAKTSVKIANDTFYLSWGPKHFIMPFMLELVDFQLERYPGSHSASSYASEVRILDEANKIDKPYRIYMNHVLDYGGFRFFQSSYDLDEKGTILSINKDPGKYPTYFGYALLMIGLVLNLINPNSRFRKLSNSINRSSMTKCVLILFFMTFFTQNSLHATQSFIVDKKEADLFGTILVQSVDGRIKPLDTLNRELLSKIYKKNSFNNQNANQVILSMMVYPHIWQKIPMIKINEDEIKKLIGIDIKAKYASFDDFFNQNSIGERKYKLLKKVEEAQRKKPNEQNKVDKELIKVDERLNVSYLIYIGELLRIFPSLDNKNKAWYNPNGALAFFLKVESENIQNLLQDFFGAILDKERFEKAQKSIEAIKAYQIQYASDIIPGQNRIKMELFFNEFKIFENLTLIYLLAGFFLLFAIVLKMFFSHIDLKIPKTISFFVIFLAFLAHTTGLGMRWYIATYAPWSNSYESMVYIAWALAFCGILFSRQSPISLALTAILSGISLFVAHLSWLDPQITTLVPVLKSYWLTIHVSVITASYGFLGLCSLLGFFTLILIAIQNPKKINQEVVKNIQEATKINEMSMILGLSLLTIGNFLGAIWANESWGRYWGWDAKETWSLISILIYSAVVHIRLIPKLNNQFYFAVFSMFAYWSIIMTYFGVNFYLSGMHSYASGDPVPMPNFVPILVLCMIFLSVIAFFKRKNTTKL